MKKKSLIFLFAILVSVASQNSFGWFGSGESSGRNEDGAATYSAGGEVSSSDEISGVILNSETNKPVKNATIEMKNINLGVGFYVAKSDSSGKFRIKDYIKNIAYKVDVSADGFVSYRGVSGANDGIMKIYLTPESIISGKVTDSAGEKLSGVSVRVQPYYSYNYETDYSEEGQGGEGDAEDGGEDRDSSSGSVLRPAETSSDGTYSFNKLVSGSYYLTFSKAGYISETVQIKQVKKSEEFSLNMKLYKPSSVSGKLSIDGVNVPASNINVYLQGSMTFSAVSFDDGSFSIEDVKPGRYEMKISHPGFYEQSVARIVIKEGTSSDGFNFVMKPREPEADVSAYRYTFAPGQQVSFDMRTFRIETATVNIYKVPVDFFLKGNRDPYSIDPSSEKFEKALSWKEPVNDFTPYEWRYQTLVIKDPLPSGGYCIEVKGEENCVVKKFFTVTSIGTVIKRSPSSVFVYASNLVTNEPVKGAKIALYSYKSTESSDERERIEKLASKEVASGITDARGISQIKTSSTDNLMVLAVAPDQSYAIASAATSSWLSREANRCYIYTDRPVYRSGDKVFFKVISKKRGDILTPMAGTEFVYRIENSDSGKIISEGNGTFDQWGTFNGDVRIEESAGLGTYVVRIGESTDNLYASGRFYVEQYRKPEFKVDVTPAKEFFMNGETAEFRVDAKYFFGAPLKNAVIKYRFYEKRADFTYGGDSAESGRTAYDKLRLEGEKNLDDSGVAVLRLDTSKLPFDRKITLEATVTDATNISISSSGSVRVGKGEFYIKIKPDKTFFDAAETKKIFVETFSQTGKPVSANVNVSIHRYVWKPVQRVYIHDKKPIFSAKVSTNEKGQGYIEVPSLVAYGEFDVVASGNDRFGNEISSSRVITIYGGDGDVSSKIGNLEMEVDKAELDKPGELTVLLKSRFNDAYVCLTLEGRDVYLSNTVKMKGNIMALKVPVKAEYAPNFYLTATMQRGRALYTAQSQISLPVKNTAMKIDIKMDKEKYLPGEKAVITLKATDVEGKPLRGDLSLAAVDESIFSIRADNTPEINSFFYAKISNWVLTTYSYPINVYAGAGKDSKPQVRSKFEDTAFWKGDIKTDEKGEVRVEFVLPDNLTTWRVTVRGHDRSGFAGEARAKFLVTQDLVSRIGKPRFFVEGDSVGLIGVVTSNTARGLENVNTKLVINGAEMKPDTGEKISLPGFGTHSRTYTSSVPSEKEMVLRFDSVADKEAKDAVQYKVPVEKRGSKYRLFGIAEAGKGTELKFLKSGDDFEFIPERAIITLNPSPLYQMVSACNYLAEYPYGCIEQTINKFLPSLALYKMLKMKNAASLINADAAENLDDRVKTGVSRIQSMQNSDGTWGWFAGDRGNEFLTCYALYSLYLAHSYGYPVAADTVSLGMSALERMLKEKNSSGGRVSGAEEIANILFVYSINGWWDNEAYLDLKKMNRSSYSNAFIARALCVANARRDGDLSKKGLSTSKELSSVMKELTDAMKRDAEGPYWESPFSSWSYQGSRNELTAHVLAAFAASGQKGSVPAQIAVAISKRAKGGIWVSTKETASVILAMTEYFKGEDDLGASAGSVALKLNGNNVGDIKFDPNDKSNISDRLTRYVDLSGMGISGAVNFESEGSAGKGATVSVVVEGTVKFNPKGFTSVFKSEKGSLQSLSNGISVTRSFYTLKRVFDSAGAEFLIPEEIKEGDEIKAGDEIMTKVRFSASDSLEYLSMEDYLPSGFEVSRLDAYGGYKFYSRAERWDNRIVYFFSSVNKGEVYEVAYTMRAELSGKFMARPGVVGCMYEPSIQGWSAPCEIEVKKK